ncbi:MULTISPECIES: lipopolysaccharide assembly LapA domain-containing protein [unclassified Nocardia]|uniref:LapA family protein n=2 Tax=Nocardia TaxID=1817 RepID=UPI00278BCE02|nr:MULTISPECIES: lipopolysaccharide assembly protein LapA domain-containing protein [unclassified Nocardia]
MGRIWVSIAIGALLTVLMLIFVLQNTDDVNIAFLAWNFDIPLGAALVLAMITGVLAMALAGGARIWQLRRVATKKPDS